MLPPVSGFRMHSYDYMRPGRKRVTDPKPSREGPVRCHECSLSFSSPEEFQVHKEKCHKDKEVFTCEKCRTGFFSAEELENHLESYSTSRFLKCDFCEQLFTYPPNLERHKLTHDSDRVYKCKICHKKFCNSINLNIHAAAHTGKSRFDCRECYSLRPRKCFLHSAVGVYMH